MAPPILSSIRLCPYAMRARMSIVREAYEVELREVVLRDRPDHMMEISPKGTVPVLLLPNGAVIEESLEMDRNDNEFKIHLDRYKYPNRYDDVDEVEQRTLASVYLTDLDARLAEGPAFASQLNDALFPFVRQFANHDRDWFDAQLWANLHVWLSRHLESDEFKRCMKKEKQWQPGTETVLFP